MVRKTSIDYLKKRKKFVRLNAKKHNSISTKEQYIIKKETHAILFQALETLSKKCRKVFKLSCLDGAKYKVLQ